MKRISQFQARRVERLGSLRGLKRSTAVAVMLIGCVGFSSGAFAAKSGAKQAEKFRTRSEDTRKAIEQGKGQVEEALAIYNSIIKQEAKKPQDAFKKLTKSVEGCEKQSADIRKRVDAMKQEAESFFKSWEEESAKYQSESFKAQSQRQLEGARKRFDGMIARMGEGRHSYESFISSLKDQILFLGRDLSPESIAHLQDAAVQVNSDADSLLATIDKILSDEVEDEAEVAEIAIEEEPQEGAEGVEASEGDEEGE